MLRTSAAHVIVADIEDVALDAHDAHHLGTVLRLRPGEVVSVTDGAGRWRTGTWADGAIVPDGPVHTVPRPVPTITIGFAPVKGDRPEWTVQKLTELGVDRILVLHTTRSVVRWEGAKADKQLERLRRVAREAAGQSRRCYLPEIEMVAALPAGALAQFEGDPLTLDEPTVLIGPEGGWTDEEVAGRRLVSLGPTVLRAETAAVAAAARLAAMRS